MLEVAGEELVNSLTHAEEAMLLGEDPELQEGQATAPHTPIILEEASESEDAFSLGVMAADPQNTWRQIPPPPPGFAQLLVIGSGPPPLKDANMPMGIPQGAQLNLASLSSMQINILLNNMTGELEYHY